MEHVK